jgi:uncharacterized membrane protein YgdD (TMEM256/DUF423 family)
MTIERLAVAAGALAAGAGVALLAASAHAATPALGSAATLLVLHGVALVAVAGALGHGLLRRRVGVVALAGLAAGPVLFATDIAARAVSGGRLFAMAAPAGGTIIILAWLALALAALAGPARVAAIPPRGSPLAETPPQASGPDARGAGREGARSGPED